MAVREAVDQALVDVEQLELQAEGRTKRVRDLIRVAVSQAGIR